MRLPPWLLLFGWLSGSAAATGCAFFPPLPASGLEPAWQVEEIAAEQIVESSGLVASRRYPGVFWTHNDSGDRARIFAIDAEGQLLREFPVEAPHRDWEDITTDGAGHLYVGDFGNNANKRRELQVYRLPEPDPTGDGVLLVPDQVLRFRYADQRAYPDPDARNFDTESLFWMEGALHLFTKHRSDTRTTLYRLPVEPSEGVLALEPWAHFELGGRRSGLFGNATGADLHADGRRLALLTYAAIHLFERTPEANPPFRALQRISLPRRRTGIAESIAWDGDGLLFGNEGGHLFRLPADQLAR